MKNILLIFFLFPAYTSVSASSADLFNIDRDKITLELSELHELELFIKSNYGITYEEVELINPSLLINTVAYEQNPYSLKNVLTDPPLNIPSFWWGFGGSIAGCVGGYFIGCPIGCLFGGLAGVAFIHYDTKSKQETRKAIKGCAVGSAISSVPFIVFFAAYMALLAPMFI